VYGWLWRHLPGPTAVRLLIVVVLLAAVVAVLFAYVFPWLQPRLPFNEVTVEGMMRR
jgi:phage shock protein PspC (stress-responsive transcriptional regulator)